MPDQFMFIVWWGVIGGGVLLLLSPLAARSSSREYADEPNSSFTIAAGRLAAAAVAGASAGCPGPEGAERRGDPKVDAGTSSSRR